MDSPHITGVQVKPVLEIDRMHWYYSSKFPDSLEITGIFAKNWELVYINQGTLEIAMEEEACVVETGEIYIIKPNVPNGRKIKSSNTISTTVGFSSKSSIINAIAHRIIVLTPKEREYLNDGVHLFQANLGSNKMIYKMKYDTPPDIVQESQVCLMMLLLNIIRREKNISARTKTKPSHLAERIIEYLEQNIAQKLTIEQIAADFGYSVPYIKQIFKKNTGMGIIEFFLKMKMDEAKRMLREGKLNITQISEKLGFFNVSHFGRAFKQREGVTPREYGRT